MTRSPNQLRWDGRHGHYEVYYLTLTDTASGLGVWIRYTMTAPLPATGGTPSAALWFVASDGRGVLARKQVFPIGRSYQHVYPLVERLGVAQTVLELPHADLAVEGTLTYAGRRIELAGARGGQAHLWGAKHAEAWAWVHCNDLLDVGGDPVPGAFVDAVSVSVRRGRREVGPLTPVVGCFGGRDFRSVSPLRVLTNWSSYALTGWRFEAIDGARKLIVEVDAARDQLAGVTYFDPDGDPAYCYNTETASIRLHLYERAPRVGGWAHAAALRADGRAHFEYAQRAPVSQMELHLR